MRYLPKTLSHSCGNFQVWGKTRFAREQAKVHNVNLLNYCLVSVRRPTGTNPPIFWGYISRIGQQGPRYMVTDFSSFSCLCVERCR